MLGSASENTSLACGVALRCLKKADLCFHDCKHAFCYDFPLLITIGDGNLMDTLDQKAGLGNWLIEENKELAPLGLSCAELSRKDRPDLYNQVLPVR